MWELIENVIEKCLFLINTTIYNYNDNIYSNIYCLSRVTPTASLSMAPREHPATLPAILTPGTRSLTCLDLLTRN